MNDAWKSQVEEHISKTSKPLIVVLGPTASGKTSFSIELAHHLGNGEIVNADSRQLYKYLDIGTAKITEDEMEGVSHHLIDVLDPKEEATAGWYQVEAEKVIEDCLDRGKVPLLVGGSMLYIATITDGLTLAPEPDDELREQLLTEYDKDEGETLFKRLTEIDPEVAERIHIHNKPRLIRAVELFELTNKPKAKSVPSEELRSSESKSNYDLLIFGMEWEREKIHERINQRCEAMFAGGWVEEVQSLLNKGYVVDDPGMKSHGYREIAESLLSNDDPTLLIESIAAKTRQYARRQETWWRNDSRIHWIQCHGHLGRDA